MTIRTVCLFLFLLPLIMSAQNLVAERKLYSTAHSDEQASEALLELTQSYEGVSSPIQLAYRGAALMVAAQFATGSGNKLKLFKEGRVLMAEAIHAQPESVEIHFLRMTIQENAPNMLRYNDSIEQDKSHIIKQFAALKDSGMKRMVQDHAVSSALYTEEEKAKLLSDQ